MGRPVPIVDGIALKGDGGPSIFACDALGRGAPGIKIFPTVVFVQQFQIFVIM
jgi:hypothetical protein